MVALKRTPERIIARFWSFVDQTGGPDSCWLWQKYCDKKSGYGQFKIDGKILANTHRFSYVITFGQVPEGMVVRHKCDNPPCCNPGHLRLGTHADNVRDRVERKRSANGEKHGRAKLKNTDVVDIRNKYVEGKGPIALAREYGVDPAAIRNLLIGKTWKSVTSIADL